MSAKSKVKTWLLRGTGVALVSVTGYLLLQRIKKNQLQSRIRRQPGSDPTVLTRPSLVLLLDEAKSQIHPKILKLTHEARKRRKSVDPSSEAYSTLVRADNQRISKCIQATLERIVREARVEPAEFDRSVEAHQDGQIQMKLFDLTKIRSPRAPQLSAKEIAQILGYFIKVLQCMDEISQLELLDLEIMFTQVEDKVYHRFGVEKTDVERQAQALAAEDASVAELLRVYRGQSRQKEALIQGAANWSTLQTK